MNKGKKKQFFAGGNTIYGFHSLFHYIPGPETEQMLIIKGGPGTGKSTLMQRISDRVTELGYDNELFHCSSDHNSLDGLSVPALNFAMADGTAPHVIDPRLPGAYDEIINLGNCWNPAVLRRHKNEIANLIQQNGDYFIRAYQYLKEANIIMERHRHLMSGSMNYRGVTELGNRLVRELASALPPLEKEPYKRHLFGSAISPGGLVNFYSSIFSEVSSFYLLTGDPGTGKSQLLQRIYETVSRNGQDVEVYHCAFDPQRIDALVVLAIKTAFVKTTYPHAFALSPAQHIEEQHTLSLGAYLNASKLRSTVTERFECQDQFWYMVNKAVDLIRQAKQNHDQLEDYYIKAMNFDYVDMLREQIVHKILEMAEKKSQKN